eukprot:gene8436-10015_t
MKENFQAILLKAKLEDKLPSRKDLVEHQESVQDLIDIFVTIASAGETKPGKYLPDAAAAAVTEGLSSSEHDANGRSKPVKKESSKTRIRRTINEKHLDRIWSVYVQNHMQYLSRDQIQATARELDRSEDSIQYHLRKMIAAHRNVPVEDALNDAFTKSDDKRIWSSYLRNVDGDHIDERKIVTSLSQDLHRTAEDVHNRLQWLKAKQSQHHHDDTSDHSVDSDEAQELRYSKKHKHRQGSHSSKSQTEAPHEHRRHKHYTSEENTLIEKAHQQDNLSPSEIGQVVGRTEKAIQHRLRESKHSEVGTTATPRAPQVKRYVKSRSDGDEDSSDESTFEVVDRTSNHRGAHRHTRTTATTNAAATSSTSAVASQWFEDGRFSDAPRRRSRDKAAGQGGVGEPSDRKRRKRAADFMQDAFQCDTFDAGIDSYSDMDSD